MVRRGGSLTIFAHGKVMDRLLAWQTTGATLLLMAGTLLSGCAALDLLGGHLPGNEEDVEPLVEPLPYPPAKQVEDGPPPGEGASHLEAQAPAPIVSPLEAKKPPVETGDAPQTSLTDNSAKPAQAEPAAGQSAAIPPIDAAPDKPASSAEAPQKEPAKPDAASSPAASPPVVQPVTDEASLAGGAGASADSAAEAAPTPEQRLSDLIQRRDELIASLEAEIKLRSDKPGDAAELLRLEQQLRLLYLLADRPDDAVTEVASLPPAEQEAFKQLLFGLNTWLSPEEERRASLRNALVLRSLKEASGELAAAAKLDVANLRFCESVEGFGWYKEFPTAQFRARQQVILYAEVDNFATERKNADNYETELKVAYQIFDAAGTLVEERELPLDKETCRNQRRDYFLAYRIYLPDGIPAGRYRLELTVEDLKARDHYQGRKLGTGLIDFSVRE